MECIDTDGRCLRRRADFLQRDRQRTTADECCQVGRLFLCKVTLDDTGGTGDDLFCCRIGNDLVIQHDDDRIVRNRRTGRCHDRSRNTAVCGDLRRFGKGLCALAVKLEGNDIACVFRTCRQRSILDIVTCQDDRSIRQRELQLGCLTDHLDRVLRVLNTRQLDTDPVRSFQGNIRIGQTHGVDTAQDDKLCSFHRVAQFFIGHAFCIRRFEDDVDAAVDIQPSLDLGCDRIHLAGNALHGDEPAENGKDDQQYC